MPSYETVEWRDRLVGFLDAVDRYLGGGVKYRLGMRYRRQRRFEDALDAFVQAEQMLAIENGVDGPYVVSAIIRQANCLNDMGKTAEACREYRRALGRLNEIGMGDHRMAAQISEYVAAVCAGHPTQAR